MRTLQFKCTLKSDVIINQRSATEGLQDTLDFIPGGNFLGIVARELYGQLSSENALKLFHSGAVRFGDAHPLCDNRRSLRVPASMFYPKFGNAKRECYIHHAIPSFEDQSEEFRCKQLKQCRSGFCAFQEEVGVEIEIKKTFTLKSAYDKNRRRSKDEALFGYDSIDEGTIYCFEVECTDAVPVECIDRIRKSLVGEKRVGRSKSAQYGLVEITTMDSVPYTESSSTTADGLVATVYADGRLIFLDEETGFPTFQPTVEQLGLTGGRIRWEESQIRTFQYAPWNGKRQVYDSDRCGIEKGSVFVVENATSPVDSQYIGVYNNEGFGKVIYNPDFLEADTKTGKALYRFCKANEADQTVIATALDGDVFLRYLARQKEKKTIQMGVYEIVNKFTNDSSRLFVGSSSGEAFASQWGAIRSIAMQHIKKGELITEIDKYLSKGIAEDKWADRGRKKALDEFMSSDTFTEENAQLAIINLAAEMAKKCSKNGRK